MYILSLSRYPGWVYEIIVYGTEDYNMGDELFHVIPYFAPLLRPIDVLALNLVPLSLSYYAYGYLTRTNSMKDYMRVSLIPLTMIFLGIVSLVIGLSVNDCIFSIDDIMREVFNNTVAKYVNLGSVQLVLISTSLSVLSLLYSRKNKLYRLYNSFN